MRWHLLQLKSAEKTFHLQNTLKQVIMLIISIILISIGILEVIVALRSSPSRKRVASPQPHNYNYRPHQTPRHNHHHHQPHPYHHEPHPHHLHYHLERVASKVDPDCADQGRQLVCRHQGKPAVRNIIKGTNKDNQAKNNKETAAKKIRRALVGLSAQMPT